MESYNLISIIITIIMGLGWGSFSTMATYRIPRNMTWVGDCPRCFLCKHPLNILDYFSIVSYFIHKKKCRYCNQPYESCLSYFIVESSITLLFILCYLKFNFGDMFFLTTGITVAIVISATIDAEFQKIPSKPLISLLIIGIIYRMFLDNGDFYGLFYNCIFAMLLGIIFRIIYFLFKGKKEIATDFMKWQHEDRFCGPGFDYVKLLAICGIYLNMQMFITYFILTLIIIILWTIIHKKSIRPGSIMLSTLWIFIIYQKNIYEYITLHTNFL